MFFFSSPPTILSTASRKSCLPTTFLFLRAAINAASLQTLAISAPEKPGVCLARNLVSTESSFLIGRKCTSNISFLSLISASSTKIWRSKRPALIRALSRTSARLVAASTITLVLVPNPSISVRSWFSVFSRSSLEPEKFARPLARPMASISSIKIIEGDFSLACLKRSLTREAPTPTNISTKSDPDKEKNGTLASPATALASKVFPVPGGPTKSAPLGIFPPKDVYFSGFLRKSTISWISSFAPSSPATSRNVVFTSVFWSNNFALDLPILKICPPAPPPAPDDILRIIKIQTPIISTNGNRVKRKSPQTFCSVS